MKTADMRYILTVERRTRTRDEGGGFVDSWQTVTGIPPLWCALQPQIRAIIAENRQNAINEVYKVMTRYRKDVKIGDRLWDGENECVYEIESLINPDGRKAYIEMTARRQDHDNG